MWMNCSLAASPAASSAVPSTSPATASAHTTTTTAGGEDLRRTLTPQRTGMRW